MIDARIFLLCNAKRTLLNPLHESLVIGRYDFLRASSFLHLVFPKSSQDGRVTSPFSETHTGYGRISGRQRMRSLYLKEIMRFGAIP